MARDLDLHSLKNIVNTVNMVRCEEYPVHIDVVGHWIQDVINPACEEMVWRVDIGMSAFYGGTTQVLQIQDGEFTIRCGN